MSDGKIWNYITVQTNDYKIEISVLRKLDHKNVNKAQFKKKYYGILKIFITIKHLKMNKIFITIKHLKMNKISALNRKFISS